MVTWRVLRCGDLGTTNALIDRAAADRLSIPRNLCRRLRFITLFNVIGVPMDHHENLISIHQYGNVCEQCQGSGWIDPTNRDVCWACCGNGEPQNLDETVTPAWLDSQSWLQKQDDMEHFKTWIAFSEPQSRKRLEVFWHSPCDHVGEWSAIYIGRDVTQSNPTVRQVLAFKHAFELMVK